MTATKWKKVADYEATRGKRIRGATPPGGVPDKIMLDGERSLALALAANMLAQLDRLGPPEAVAPRRAWIQRNIDHMTSGGYCTRATVASMRRASVVFAIHIRDGIPLDPYDSAKGTHAPRRWAPTPRAAFIDNPATLPMAPPGRKSPP